MRKKVQAALPIWMEEFLERQAEKYDITISEAIRLAISIAIICHTGHKYEDFKTDLEKAGVPKGVREMMDDPEAKRIISDIYFEARKAVEFLYEKEALEKTAPASTAK